MNDRPHQITVVGDLTVAVVELEVAREAELGCGRSRLVGPDTRHLVEICVGVTGALLAPRGDQHPHLGTRGRPASQGAAG